MSRQQAAALLDVAPDATPQQVKTAFRRTVRTHHPDRGGTAQQFTAALAARDLLLQPQSVGSIRVPTTVNRSLWHRLQHWLRATLPFLRDPRNLD